MCTVTIQYQAANRFSLGMNRDESRARPLAREVREELGQAGTKIYPVDPQGGGSWIGINQRGIAVALLNHYGCPPPAEKVQSRGQIVVQLLDAKNLAEATSQLLDLELAQFGGFRVAVLSASGGWVYAVSDRKRLIVETIGWGTSLLVSSAYQEAEVAKVRAQTFWEWTKNGNWLAPFHASHKPSEGAKSVCMHREDAHTVSFTEIHWDGRKGSLRYRPGSPCKSASGDSTHQIHDT